MNLTPELITILQQVNDSPADVRAICDLLKVESTKLLELQYQAGMAFLNSHLGMLEHDKQALQNSKAFWSFFARQWNLANDYMRADPESIIAINMGRTEYHRHNTHQLGIKLWLEENKVNIWQNPALIPAARKELHKAA